MPFLSHEKFINSCPKDKFIFLSNYQSQKIPITGKCLICGTISTKLPKTFQNGRCRGCANINHPGGFFRSCKSNEQFLNEAKIVHGDAFDYLEPYQRARIKIKIRCKTCQTIFYQWPQSHLDGNKCKRCMHNNRFSKVNEFETACMIIHDNQYEYFQDYQRASKKIKIKCKTCHSIFYQIAGNHKNSEAGCSNCCVCSKGERKVKSWLDHANISYSQHFKFDDCKYVNKLIFDFYLPDYNTCIEYDGEQHYKTIPEWGGYQEFNRIKIRDSIKNDYCKNNNINLIRIPYYESDNINYILDKQLLKISNSNDKREPRYT